MKKSEKAKVFNRWDVSNGINDAKSGMWYASDILEENGLFKDAETLRKMVYRLEAFQTKYDEHRL